MTAIAPARQFPLPSAPWCQKCKRECERTLTRNRDSPNFDRWYYHCKNKVHNKFRTFDDNHGISPNNPLCDCSFPTRRVPHKKLEKGTFLKCSAGECAWEDPNESRHRPPQTMQVSGSPPPNPLTPSSQLDLSDLERSPSRTPTSNPFGLSTETTLLLGTSAVSPPPWTTRDTVQTPSLADYSQPSTPENPPRRSASLPTNPLIRQASSITPTRATTRHPPVFPTGKAPVFQLADAKSCEVGSSSRGASPFSESLDTVPEQKSSITAFNPSFQGEKAPISDDTPPPSEVKHDIHLHLYIHSDCATHGLNNWSGVVPSTGLSSSSTLKVHLHQTSPTQHGGNYMYATVPESGLEPLLPGMEAIGARSVVEETRDVSLKDLSEDGTVGSGHGQLMGEKSNGSTSSGGFLGWLRFMFRGASKKR